MHSMKLDGEYINRSFARHNLAGCILSGTFQGCDFSGADLRKAKLNGRFISVTFVGANLSGADRSSGTFVRCSF